LLFPSASSVLFIAEIARILTPQKRHTAIVGAVIINLIRETQVTLLAAISEDKDYLPNEVPRLAFFMCL